MGTLGVVFLVLITILFPPLGVYLIAGCGVDLLVNICLTLLAYIPGHVHAFYLMYVYYERRGMAMEGRFNTAPAPGVYSDRVQSGGRGYGTIVQTD
ncbi:hypothetical protein OIDMADRAFT_19701 [Oidiodendron maius Zn]|uniref:Stress response RCI peptide n=1 Tax=Oidiodendron maius (strain Zn) TaxID=913774 RepID=A0A0C3CKW9_OIDMZ|nr:hypothetical protein OIDMADRAFT_19701 [Oidiodendron maius Zn]